ncbi:MAG: ATP-binding protein [Bacteroidota bacterium]|nr:ATP-binding protein [Bacteroidota bacterium]
MKPEDQLGEPGSRNRNPYIAAIFHETNLAETKGSGIRTMKTLMEKAELLPPTFESDHGNNSFTVRLLLHHFLNEEDIKWLSAFNHYDISDSQKRALIFLREVGAIDNATHRQMNGLEILKASTELRSLRDKEIIIQKGKSRSTYYIPNTQKSEWGIKTLSAPVPELSAPVEKTPDLQSKNLSEPVENLSEPVDQALVHQLPEEIQRIVNDLPQRSNDPALVEAAILVICEYQPYKSVELSAILGRSEKYLLRNFLTRLREEGKLEYTHPEMANHPQQAYKTVKND